LEKLAGAPIKLQEFAPGEDTRGYVVDGEFAGMIRYDYDTDAISFQCPSVDYSEIESVELSPDPEVREAVVRAGELSPSTYAAVDVRLTDDGDFTVLESNTPGRFAAHDLAGSTDVADYIAEYLVES
jgi:glutathione synthase/RimK-type ligase-like ATP-grasp enzyme